jgi:hypothetical protein
VCAPLRSISIALALLCTVGCARAQTAHSAPTASPWPSYLAKDYDKPGHPALTSRQVALIRKTLALVRPCQVAVLLYAFPENIVPNYRMVLFFRSPNGWPHALWTDNMYYKEVEGKVFPGASGPYNPDPNGIRYEVEHTGCDGVTIYPIPRRREHRL